MRALSRLTAVAIVVALGLVGSAGASFGADAEGGDEEKPPTNPLDLAVPYFGHLEVTMPQGWTVRCAGLKTPKPVTLHCESTGLTLDAHEYEAGYGVHVLPAVLSHDGHELEVHYRVSLAPPEPPTGAELREDFPVPAGSVAYLPQNELGITCDGCREHRPVLEAVGVDPATAGSLAVTSSHLVFSSAPSFAGVATLGYRITDEQKQTSDLVKVEVVVTNGRASLAALHVVAPLTKKPVQYTLEQLVAGAAPDDLRVIGCDDPVYGTVTCVGDRIRYTPEAKPGTGDQFGFTLFSLSLGEQVHGSVTLLRPEKGEKTKDGVALVTETPRAKATSMLPIPPPPDDDAASADAEPSVFDPIVATLAGDRS